MKKKLTLLILFFIIFLGSITNAQIATDKLKLAAKNYIKNDNLFKKNYLPTGEKNIEEIYDEESNLLAYVTELKPEGFIVFSSSESLYPVIAYSYRGFFNYEKTDDNTLLNLILVDLGCQNTTLNKKSLTEKQKSIIRKNKTAWENLINDKNLNSKYDYEYGPNLPDIWGGVNCVDDNGTTVYVGNYYTPNHYSPGCVATSLSQILHLFEWPPVGEGEHTDYDNSGSSQGSYYAGFGRMWYDWDNMLDEYYDKPSTDTEQRAMGRLAYHCGVAEDMEYESSGSTSNVNRSPAALDNYFRSCGHYETSSWTSFWTRLRSNIENGYAVQLAVRDVSSGAGHANVCDGWRQNIGNDIYYHLNNGWWGTCNAWYRLQVSFSDCGYDAVDAGVFDILPDPMFVDDAVRDNTNTKTFTLNWNVSKHLNWDAFELQESVNNGVWTTLDNNITDTFYTRTVSANGLYKYQVRAKSSGYYYADSYSEECTVPVEELIYLDFDGDDSYFVYDNPVNDLDISNNWTIESWVKVDSYANSSWSAIMDRRTVFSLYLLDDTDADFAVKFAVRDASDAIIASVSSETSSVNLSFDKWFHVAVSFDGTTVRLFLNGELVEESTDTDFNLTASTNALNIGARWWGSYERYLDGQIDEIRISDTARYTADFCPDRFNRFITDNNSVILLHMDAGAGTTVKDYAYNFIKPVLRASTNDPGWAFSTCPIITKNPEDMSVCQGSVSFSVSSVQTLYHQWQEDSGSGFVNLSNGGVYSGTTTDTLIISNVTGLDGYKYRCIANDNASKDCSTSATLTVYSFCTIWNGSVWSNGEPDLTMSALIAGNYTLPHDIAAKELTVLEDDTIWVPQNLTLTAQNYFENHGVIVLQSLSDNTPTGALLLNGTQNNYGDMIAQRFFSVPDPGVWGNWHLISFPFTENIQTGNVFSSADYVYKNLEPVYDWQRLADTDFMNAGEGYLLQVTQTGGLFTKQKGTFGNGAYSHTLPLTSGTNLGWFLATNPYPSPIDWNAASGWTKTNINSTVYTFDPENNGGSNQYSTWDGSVGTYSGLRYINSFQGFFVQALADGAVIGTDNNIRVKNSDVSGDYLKDKNFNDLVRLEIESPEGKKDEIVAYFGKTESKSFKAYPLDENAPSLFLADNENKYVIERFPYSDKNVICTVSLNSKISGQYKLVIKELYDTDYNVFLKNKMTNEIYAAKAGDILTFDYSESESEIYELQFVKNAENITDNNNVSIFSFLNTVYINRDNNSNAVIKIADISGKLYKLSESKDNQIIISGLESGFYIVVLTDKNGTVYKKIIIK